MDTESWVIAVSVVVLLAVVVTGVLLARKRQQEQQRTDALRERFGPEYDRTVERTGSRPAAEDQLAAVAEQRERLSIRPLAVHRREELTAGWADVQGRFVDEPGQAVSDADTLVTAVLRERGYPVEDFYERASLVAMDHPDVVERYRAAHAAHARHLDSSDSDTEDLRQSFTHYRALFLALVDDGRPARAERPSQADEGAPSGPQVIDLTRDREGAGRHRDERRPLQ